MALGLPKICILIPTLNEAEGIGPTIKEIIHYLNKPEILVVDANSDDGTLQIAFDLGAKVIMQQGRGKGRAIARALEHVTPETRYLAIIDGDYTYPASYIPQMLKILDKNKDVGMVTGDRFNHVDGLVAHMKSLLGNPFYFGNKLLRLAHRLVNRVKLKDPLTGLRVIRYEIIKGFRPKAKGFDVEVETNNFIRKKGYKIVEVPIEYRSRLGKKKLRIKHGFAIFARVVIMAIGDFLDVKPALIEV